MSALTEFIWVALALYLWESTLWIPLRGVALRRRWFQEKWKVLDPRALVATRRGGLVAMLPLPPDAGLAPCQAPPLLVTAEGGFLVETTTGNLVEIAAPAWSDLTTQDHDFSAAGISTRLSSPRCAALLKRARDRGATPAEAVRQAWRLALSPDRSMREWRRWKLVSTPLRWYGPVLAAGIFAGLPLAYVFLGSQRTILLAVWLWGVMAMISVHLWWLGKRVYPDARSAFRMDAMLALFVPFHAMRALEIASVHAMGTTHAAGLMLASGDFANPWLGAFVRRMLHPLPENADAGFASALRAPLASALARSGRRPEDFDVVPDRSQDEAAARYCPRCHGLYQAHVTHCTDCRGLALRDFEPFSGSRR